MSKIKIVTAFFDIGRKDFELYPRTNEQYFEYFKFWARLRNDMIVFCAPENKERITEIRRNYGLEDRTAIIEVEDVFSIEPELFNRMLAVEQDEDYQNFRYRYHDPSNYADYDYVVGLKSYFLSEAAKLTKEDCHMAWIDFGYNHGGEFYQRSDDFDFLWNYPFSDKINMFCLNDPDKLSLIDSLQFQYDCFAGHTIILPKNMCGFFWEEIKTALIALLDIGCIDDDQQLDLMVYKKHKNLFEIRIIDWFTDFLLVSDQEFLIKEKSVGARKHISSNNISIWKRITQKVMWCYRRITDPNYLEVKRHPFIIRMEQKLKKYY